MRFHKTTLNKIKSVEYNGLYLEMVSVYPQWVGVSGVIGARAAPRAARGYITGRAPVETRWRRH